MRLWGIIQLHVATLMLRLVLLVLRNPRAHLKFTTAEKNEIVGANCKLFAEGILYLTRILRKQL